MNILIIVLTLATITRKLGGITNMSSKTPNTTFLSFEYGNHRNGTAISNSTDFMNIESISINKTCLSENYFPGDSLTYIISVNNNSNIPIFNIKVKEDIGNNASSYLKYMDIYKCYINGAEYKISPPKSYSDRTIFELDYLPATSNALLIYSASVTESAPMKINSLINNNSSLIVPSLGKTLKSDNSLKVRETADVKIIKQIKNISSNHATYSLKIYNYGNIHAKNLTINDKSEHIFSKLQIRINNKIISESNYTYSAGKLQIPSYGSNFSMSVPEADFTKDESSEKNVITPGTLEILIEGDF